MPSAAARASKMRQMFSTAISSSGKKNMPTAYSPSPPRETPASAAQRAKSACGRRVMMPTPSPVVPVASLPARCASRFDDGQRVGYCAVRGLSAQVDHRTHAAGFVFHLRVVERISGRHGGFLQVHAFDCKIFAARSVSFKPRSMAFFCK